jgi:hypothetical protein
LHLYIYDYFKKQKYHQAARAFSTEVSINTDQPPPIDVSLSDWWSVFWDVYYAKNKEAMASKEATTNDEVILKSWIYLLYETDACVVP